MLIDTPLLVVGRGPAPLVVAKLAAGWGLPCLLVGHDVTGGDTPVALDADAVAALTPHGALDVLRPYLDAVDPPTISPRVFEEVLKHHCVADFNVTVYDRMTVVDRVAHGRGVHAVLTDGKSRWDLAADVFVDGALLPDTLPIAVTAAGTIVRELLAARAVTAGETTNGSPTRSR